MVVEGVLLMVGELTHASWIVSTAVSSLNFGLRKLMDFCLTSGREMIGKRRNKA